MSNDSKDIPRGDSTISSSAPRREDSTQWMLETESIAGIGSWRFIPSDREENWSPGLRKLLNVPADDPSPVLFEFVPTLEKEIGQFLRSNVPFCRRKFVLRTFEDTLVLLFQAEKRLDASGNVSCLLATLQNISDIIWTSGVPGMGDQLLESVVSSDDVLVVAVNTALTLTYVDGQGWGKLQHSPETLVGKSLHDVLKAYPNLNRAMTEAVQGNNLNLYCSVRDRYYAVKIRPLIGPEGRVAGAIAFGLDITDRNTVLENLKRDQKILEEKVRQHTRELQVRETTLQSLLATSNAGIAMVDMDLVIIYANTAIHRMLEYEDETLVGNRVDDFLKSEILDRIRWIQENHRGDPREITHFRRQIPVRKKDDSTLWVDVNAALVCDENGKPDQLVVVMFDITEQQRYLDELRQAKQESDAASVAKSQFLAHMSHEIRTPLNGVIGLSDLLMGTSLTPKQSEYVGLIKISGKSLLFLINDILDFSKIEAGKMEIEDEEFDLLTTVESVLGILATRASDKGLELCGSFSSSIPRFVRGDSGRLRQILINLVGNALKFTVHGGVKVQVSNEKTTLSSDPCDREEMNDRVFLRFSVQDTGIGISPENVKMLFRSFTQIDNTAAKRHDGSGLGLAISKRLVELMQGSLNVESAVGIGSTFWFEIPFPCRVEITNCPAHYLEGTPENEETRCPRTGEADCPMGRRRVMHGSVPLSERSAIVVDDNDIQRETLAEQLSAWGMEVSQAATETEALEKLRLAAHSGRPYQLAVIDNTIADGDGMNLVEAMKADQTLEETAIILLTPLTVDTDIAVIHSHGIASQISKPVYSSSLFDATMTALFSKEKSRIQNFPAASDPNGEIVAEGYDERRSLVRILVAEDNTVNQLVVRDTLENVGFQCHIVGNGLLAVEAVKKEPFDAILMDCQMPEMDGFEATSLIRQFEDEEKNAGRSARRIPIIALTANATKGDEAQCLESGMDAYCSKPINPKTLVRTIDQWVKPVLKHRLAERGSESIAPFSIKTFLVLCGKNKMIATMVLSDFLNQIPKDLDLIADALEEADWNRAAGRLQHLRGKAGLLGAAMLEKAAQTLEDVCLSEEGNKDFIRLMEALYDEADRSIQYAGEARERISDDALALK